MKFGQGIDGWIAVYGIREYNTIESYGEYIFNEGYNNFNIICN